MNKVLIVLKDLRTGSGVVQAIMNYYPNISTSYDIDFLLLDNIPNSNYSKIIGKIYYLPKSKLKYSIKISRYLKNLFECSKYDIIHINITGPYAALILKYAKRYGVSHRVYHCHCPREKSTIKSFLYSNIFTDLCLSRATDFIACSNLAGLDVFKNKKFTILTNRFDTSKYKYDEEARKKLRNSMKLSLDDILFCTVGRMEQEKNPLFIVDILKKISEKNNKIKMIWFGNGSQKNKIIEYSKTNGVYNKIIFAGVSENVNKWYSAADYFILPSKYEGLGLALIEAQCSGLMSFTSSNVPQDTKISDYVFYLDINKGSEYWSNYILKKINNNTSIKRTQLSENALVDKFDIKFGQDDLHNIYIKILGNGDANND